MPRSWRIHRSSFVCAKDIVSQLARRRSHPGPCPVSSASMFTDTRSRPSFLAATLSILYCRHAFATLVTVDDRDSSLVWGGSWEPFSGQPEAEDGTLTWANNTGPTVAFTFTGKLPIVSFLLIHLARGLTALNEPAAARRTRASIWGVQAGRDVEHPVAVRGRR